MEFPALLFIRSEEHTSELQSHLNLVCRLLLEKKKVVFFVVVVFNINAVMGLERRKKKQVGRFPLKIMKLNILNKE